MTESSIALRAEFDPACRTIAIRSLEHIRCLCAIKIRANVIATDVAVLNEDVFCGFRTPQGIRAFQNDSVVIEGVYMTIPDDDPFATIDIKSVAVSNMAKCPQLRKLTPRMVTL